VRRRKDGHDIDVSLTISPVRDDAGNIIGASKIARDITERKRAETALRDLNENLERRVAERTRELVEAIEQLRAEGGERERAEAALRQAQKMEAVGQLASGMAHDFNNLLTAILGNLELIESRLVDEKVRKMVQAASRAALRGAQLNEQMLAFSRKQHLAPRPVDLNTLVRDMSDLMQRTLGGTVRVATALAPELWPALVDPTQIEMVILNLAINARDALPAGGTVRIATRNVTMRKAGKGGALRPGDYVCIAVSDDGIGMPDAVIARACEPFFTTKQPGKGSGLGLSQVYGVARQSGGDILIDSAEGRGTTIEVYLPRSNGKAIPALLRGDTAAQTSEERTLTILVVDDEPDVREVAVAHLEALGYRVAQAANARTALGLLAGGRAIDILVADYAMAEMNGLDLAKAARARRPDLPIVIMTGYSEVGAIDSAVTDAVLLKKPYRLGDLASSIEKAMRHWEDHAGSGKVVPLHRA
jgi:signal transduction histidine kinase/ActR/RegA family two-component response regulator